MESLEKYLTTRNYRDKGVGVASIDLELVFQERVEILFTGEVLAHSLRERSAGSLPQATHLDNLVLTLGHPHFVEHMFQWPDSAMIHHLLELLRCNRGTIQIPIQG
jgi:hypothetical protein